MRIKLVKEVMFLRKFLLLPALVDRPYNSSSLGNQLRPPALSHEAGCAAPSGV